MAGLSREQLAARAAQELKDGLYATLGAGLPALVTNHLPKGMEVLIHGEDGSLGIGPVGASAARGGHVDLALVRAMQVSEKGDLADALAPENSTEGPGVAMNLAAGADRVVVVMEHANEDGAPKILSECTLPIRGRRIVHRILTELAVIDVTAEGLILREVAPGVSARDVQGRTQPTLRVPSDLLEIKV
jgi:3-oxoacid CoA-transferase subunit B